jgi:4-carboxymuconolactone decarboxylase
MREFENKRYSWTGRLPQAESMSADEDRIAAIADISALTGHFEFATTTADGRLIGPFNALALRPKVGMAFLEWVATLERESSLPKAVREAVILTVGTAWDSDYELYAHIILARSVGLAEEAITAIRTGSTEDLDGELGVAFRFTQELVLTQRVRDATYRSAERTFGLNGVVDLVHLIGAYLSASALLNAFEVPAPPTP